MTDPDLCGDNQSRSSTDSLVPTMHRGTKIHMYNTEMGLSAPGTPHSAVKTGPDER